MAASSSDESSTAPKDFHLSSSLDSGSRLSPNKQRCPLCHKFRKIFYCKECVHSGLFYRSKSQSTEGYFEKQKLLLELQENKRIIESNCLKLLTKKQQADILRSKIRQNQDRNRLLRLLVEEKRKKNEFCNRELTSLKLKNEDRNRSLPKYEQKVQEVEHYVEDKKESVTAQKEELRKKNEELRAIVKIRINQLFKYIFPILKVQPKSEVESGESDMILALAEASQTTYIKDRWEYSDNSGEMQYSIVAPTLPGSGNYSSYNIWVAQNRDAVPGSASNTGVGHNPAYSISAALAYTAQLVNILSFYLNIKLPYKLMYSDFCSSDLTEQQFSRRVARLNANILYLCFTQNVDLTCLRSCETIHNLLQMVDQENINLGRQSPVELDIEQVDQLERPIVNDLQRSDDSDSEEGDTFPIEWEAVPHVQCPEVPAGPVNVQSTQAITSQQASSMAGGLYNSAAASIASIWRGFTRR